MAGRLHAADGRGAGPFLASYADARLARAAAPRCARPGWHRSHSRTPRQVFLSLAKTDALAGSGGRVHFVYRRDLLDISGWMTDQESKNLSIAGLA